MASDSVSRTSKTEFSLVKCSRSVICLPGLDSFSCPHGRRSTLLHWPQASHWPSSSLNKEAPQEEQTVCVTVPRASTSSPRPLLSTYVTSLRLIRILALPLATSSRTASRKAVMESPAVIFPDKSMIDTPSDSRRDSFSSMLFPLWFRNAVHDAFEDRVRIDTFGFSLEVQDYPMTQRRQHNVTYIGTYHMRSSGEQRAHFCADHDGLCSARACSVSQILLCQCGRHVGGGLSRHDDTDSIILNLVGNRHRKHGFAKLQDFIRAPHALHVGVHNRRGTVQNRVDIVDFRKAHFHFDEEPVQLRFRQRIGRFQFQRIQRGQHHTRLVEHIVLLSHRHRLLLHGFQQRRL